MTRSNPILLHRRRGVSAAASRVRSTFFRHRVRRRLRLCRHPPRPDQRDLRAGPTTTAAAPRPAAHSRLACTSGPHYRCAPNGRSATRCRSTAAQRSTPSWWTTSCRASGCRRRRSWCRRRSPRTRRQGRVRARRLSPRRRARVDRTAGRTRLGQRARHRRDRNPTAGPAAARRLPFRVHDLGHHAVAVVGADAAVSLTTHAALVPQVRAYVLNGALQVRPGLGLRWTF